ncbi:phosphate transport system substrate-binding protein [Arthrobacter sp. CAN_A214]
MTAWQAGFQAMQSGANIQYSPDGSGAGRDAFLAAGVQFAGSDAYLDDEEYEASKEVCGPDGAINIPAYVSPIAVAFNLPGIDSLNLDAPTIASIFRGEIPNWNDDAIAAQNEGVELPDTPITVVHRADESGTTENFTEYLAAAAPEVWADEASGDWPAEIVAENAQGTNGVVSTTTATEGAITYTDASAVGDLGQALVKVGEEYVELSPEAASRAVEVATPVDEGRAEGDMSLDLERDTTESGAYPIVLISYHIYCTSYEDQETVDLVKAFGSYAISEQGQEDAASSAGNAPISEALREQAQQAIDSIAVAS